MENGKIKKVYPVSTSKFGLGDRPGSNATPVGRMAIAIKIGGGQPVGMAFHGRQATGEIVKANAPGRDIITSRILRLSGKESATSRAYSRCIYIHGTPEERYIGAPASYGCIRMKNKDVIDLYDRVTPGTNVTVTLAGLDGKTGNLPPAIPVYTPVPRPATQPMMISNGNSPMAMVQATSNPPKASQMGPDVGPRTKNLQKTIR